MIKINEVEIEFNNFLKILTKYIEDESIIRRILDELNINVSNISFSERKLKKGEEKFLIEKADERSMRNIFSRLKEMERIIEMNKKAINDIYSKIYLLEKSLKY